MGALAWIGLFAACSALWGWLLLGGGAEWLEGSFLAGLVVHVRAPEWTADGIKVFTGLVWLGQAIWFMIGLFNRDARAFWL